MFGRQPDTNFSLSLRSGCGLNIWGSGSQILHATSASPVGPFVPAEVAVTAEAHNPQLVRAPDGSFLLMDSCRWSFAVPSVLRVKNHPSALHCCRRRPRGGLPQHMQLHDVPAGPNVRRQRPRRWALHFPRVEQYSGLAQPVPAPVGVTWTSLDWPYV